MAWQLTLLVTAGELGEYIARVRLLISTLLAAVVLTSCRTHTAQDGTYQFVFTEVLRDDCNLATAAGVVNTGTLVTTGNIASLHYGYFDIELGGIYRVALEEMVLDGNASNVSTTVRGNACLLDTAAIHLESVTQDSERFDGEMTFTLDARQTPDACACKLWVKFAATLVP